MKLKVGILSVGFPNFRYDIAQNYLDETIEYLKQKEVELVISPKILIAEEDINQALDKMSRESLDLVIFQVGTYSYGNAILNYMERIKGPELLLWAFREPIIDGYNTIPLNSLCGLNMYTSFLKKLDYPFSYLYGGLEEEKIQRKLGSLLKALAVKSKLRKSKFTIVGGRVPGFYLSNVDELNFRKAIGPAIEYYSIANLIKDAEEIEAHRVEKEVKEMRGEVASIQTVDIALEKSARIYLALKDYKIKNNVDAFAFKCWPDIQDVYGFAVCGVISRLISEGVMISCEGDVTGLTTMYIQNLLTKQAVFLTDLVNVREDGIVKVWHCGCAARTLAHNQDETAYIEHPTIKNGIGMASDLEVKKGNVLMCKLSEGAPYRMFIAAGESILADRKIAGNHTDIQFSVHGEKMLETIVEEGLEHHYSLVFEDISDELLEVCRLINIKPIVIK